MNGGNGPGPAPDRTGTVRKTTCYMCACRCGIDVHLVADGPGRPRVRYIEGNRDHPVNRGVLCAKGSAGILQHESPARLRGPLLRTGPRGSGQFRTISWDEALALATSWLAPIRATDPKRLAFFTGRDQSQSLTGFWAQQFGTPNYAAHGGFCSVNMAAAGIMTMGGAFWEFGTTDWDRCRYLLLLGVAEDHDSNPIKIGIGKMKGRGARIVAVNPVRTGYNAVADEWLGITPGTDGAFVLALVHELLRAGAVDVPYLARYTNAGWLVIDAPGHPRHGLFARDAEGRALVAGHGTGRLLPEGADAVPALSGRFEAEGLPCRPVFDLLAAEYLRPEHGPEAAASACGIPAATIRRIAAELAHVAFREEVTVETPWTDWLGRRHERMTGRPVSVHAMRGISAHANGFQTARAIHVLQILLGSVEVPGGFRFKPPCPKPLEAHPRPHADCTPGTPLPGPHLGFPRGPEDLCLAPDGSPARIDKAFSWEAPFAAHGAMHMVLANAAAGDPYRIDTLLLYMANMAWNSAMNPGDAIAALTKEEGGAYVIPHVIVADAYASETVAHADLVLPDTTYLERHDCISLLDRPISEPDAAGDAIRWPVVPPDRDVRGFQSVLIDLGARLGLPAFTLPDGAPAFHDYADYIAWHERRPGVGPLAGFRGEDGSATGRGAPNPGQIAAYIANGGFFQAHVPEEARFFKPWNRAYQDWAVGMGFQDAPMPYRFQLWLEPLQKVRLAAEGHGDLQPPDHLRARLRDGLSPLPLWQPVPGEEGFPLHAITQRPAAMYHSWGSQNAWLRQIHGANPLFVPADLCDALGLSDGDWAFVTSPHGRIRVPVRRMAAVNGATVWTWNGIGKRAGAWALGPGAPEAETGFLLNHLISELLPAAGDGPRLPNADPVTGQAAWFDLRVRIEKAEPAARSEPVFSALESPVPPAPAALPVPGARA